MLPLEKVPGPWRLAVANDDTLHACSSASGADTSPRMTVLSQYMSHCSESQIRSMVDPLDSPGWVCQDTALLGHQGHARTKSSSSPSIHEVYFLYYYCSIVNHEIGDLFLNNPEVDLCHVFFCCHCYYHPSFTGQVVQGHDQGLR